MDLPQQVLDAAVVELVAAVAVLVQLTHLAHQEVGDLGSERRQVNDNDKSTWAPVSFGDMLSLLKTVFRV